MAVVNDTKKDAERVVLARHLTTHGATAGDELAEAVGLSLERFWVLINHPWFEITGKGWDLTQEGRREWVLAN